MAEPSFNTIAGLIASLQQIAEHVDPKTIVRINGEHLRTLSITKRNPLAIRGEAYGIEQLEKDRFRDAVIDIDANGRQSNDLPTIRYPYDDGRHDPA